jgi:hypothetical protein
MGADSTQALLWNYATRRVSCQRHRDKDIPNIIKEFQTELLTGFLIARIQLR